MTQRAWWSFALAVGLLSTSGAEPWSSPGVACAIGWQPERFTLAIVRPDGRLVPFAAYDGGRWVMAWPEADEEPGSTPTLDNVPSVWRARGDPVPLVWQVWPATGVRSIQAHVNGVGNIDAHCGVQAALTTDLPLPRVKTEHPLKYGVAVDSKLRLGSIEEVRPSDAHWRAAERAVVGSFSALEAATARTDQEPSIRESPAPVVRVRTLYREATSPRSTLLFIAEKKYRTSRFPQDPGCLAATIVTGWLFPDDAGTFTVRDPAVFLTDCDWKQVRTPLPLAAFRVSDRVFWVIQEHGYEDESYGIAEIGPSGVRYPIMVNGGGC